MDHSARRIRLFARADALEVDGFYVSHLPNVRYLSGFSGSNGHLVIGAGEGLFLTDGRYTEQSRREVPGLDRTTYTGGLAPALADACARVGSRRLAFEADHLTFRVWNDLAGAGLELVPTFGLVEELRAIKDAEEIASIQAAQDAADHAYDVVTGKLVEGITEKEVAFELEAAIRRAGADGIAFDTIAAFGPNAAEPHHQPTERSLVPGDLVKLDFGALSAGYHSDMTRTVAFGEPTDELRRVYEVVREAQAAGVAAVRVGVAPGDVDGAARAVIREAGYGAAFKHPVGHGVGLEIHEAPWLRQGAGEAVPEGAVLTVEPGIYLDGVGGVRIEDMVEVTADGPRVMARAPKDLVVL